MKALRKKRQKSDTIVKKLMLPISLLMVLQGVIFLCIILYTGTLRELRENAYKEFMTKVETRKNQLETMMVKNWSYYANFEGVIQNAALDYKRSMENGEAKQMEVSRETAEQIMALLRSSGATGAFVIYDTPNPRDDKYPTYYVRDMEPDTYSKSDNDILVEMGSGELSKEMGVTMDTNWTPQVKLLPNEQSSLFYFTVMEEARKHPEIGVKDLGRWSDFFRITPNGTDIITYTMPLRDENSNVYGVVGIEVTLDYLYSFMPYDELAGNLQGGYILAINYHGKDTYCVVAENGPLFEYIIKQNRDIVLSEEKNGRKYSVYRVENISHLDHTTWSVYYPLRLYNTNTPFVGEKWNLMGIVNEEALLQSSNRLQYSMIWAFLLAIAMGMLGSIFVSFYFSRPIHILALHLRHSDTRKNILLPRVFITEIDELCEAVEKCSADVVYNASRMSQILNVMDLSIGAIEYEKETGEVFCTEQIGTLLDFSLEKRNIVNFTQQEFEVEIEKFHTKSSAFVTASGNQKESSAMKESVYQMDTEDNKTKWINFKVMEDDRKIMVVVQDVSEQIKEKLKIEYERDYDVLTNLLNRRSFCNRAEYLLKKGFSGIAAMVMWDLDNLKYINDTYGHDFGDAYIMEAAKVLNENSPQKSMVARMSGDEFLAILYDYGEKEIARQDIAMMHQKLHEATLWLPEDKYVKIRASGGIAWYPDDGTEYDVLVKHADFAMYRAKNSRKGEMQEFEERAYLRDELLFNGKEDLNLFIEERQVRFAFQPIVSAKDGSIYAYEALMRPQGANLNNIYDVMRLAKAQSKLYQIEIMSFMGAMGAYVEQKDLFGDAKIFINSIPNTCMTLQDQRRFERLYQHHLPQLVIEMIESEQTDEECYRMKYAKAKEWNAEVALDDYGSGYNTEASLLQINPKYVKIDMSIIQGIDKDKDRQQLVSGLLSYLRSRHMLSIAEGVETRGELYTLLELGVDFIQGYYLGQPEMVVRGISEQVIKEIQEFQKKRA